MPILKKKSGEEEGVCLTFKKKSPLQSSNCKTVQLPTPTDHQKCQPFKNGNIIPIAEMMVGK